MYNKNDKELKRMNRAELLEILVELSKQNESLVQQNEKLSQRLEEKQITLNEAGSIAEAALQLNNVFADAQAAADQYLWNIQNMQATVDETQSLAEQKAKSIVEEAEKEAQKIIDVAEEKGKTMLENAKREADSYWETVSRKLEEYCEEQKELKEMLTTIRMKNEQ